MVNKRIKGEFTLTEWITLYTKRDGKVRKKVATMLAEEIRKESQSLELEGKLRLIKLLRKKFDRIPPSIRKEVEATEEFCFREIAKEHNIKKVSDIIKDKEISGDSKLKLLNIFVNEVINKRINKIYFYRIEIKALLEIYEALKNEDHKGVRKARRIVKGRIETMLTNARIRKENSREEFKGVFEEYYKTLKREVKANLN